LAVKSEQGEKMALFEITITTLAEKISVKLDPKEAHKLISRIKEKNLNWISFNNGNMEHWIRTEAITSISQKEIKKNSIPGLHLRQVAEIAEIPYSTLVKRASQAKKNGGLEWLSPRRLAPTLGNFKILQIPESKWANLQETSDSDHS